MTKAEIAASVRVAVLAMCWFFIPSSRLTTTGGAKVHILYVECWIQWQIATSKSDRADRRHWDANGVWVIALLVTQQTASAWPFIRRFDPLCSRGVRGGRMAFRGLIFPRLAVALALARGLEQRIAERQDA
jgi:hypothetical protein